MRESTGVIAMERKCWFCNLNVLWWLVAETDIRRCEGADIQVGKERLNTISDWYAQYSTLKCAVPLYKWCTVAGGTFKYVVPRLTCQVDMSTRGRSTSDDISTEGQHIWMFHCNRALSVLSYDQLWASTKSRWIIYLRLCLPKILYVWLCSLATASPLY